MKITSLPPSVLSMEEQELLTEHYKNKLWIGIKHGDKPRKYSPDERRKVGAMYDAVVAGGFMITGVDQFGRLTYARQVKSAVQLMLEEGLAQA